MTTDTDVGEMIAVILLFVVAVVFYFLPGLIGSQKRAGVAIFFFNLVFGFTGIGWIVALVWSLTPDESERDRRREYFAYDQEWPIAPPPPIGKARMMWPAVAVGVISWTVLLMAGWWAWSSGLLFTTIGPSSPVITTTPPKSKFAAGGQPSTPVQGAKPGATPTAEPSEIVAEEPPTAGPSPTVEPSHTDSSTAPATK
jgi:hypothetical protein